MEKIFYSCALLGAALTASAQEKSSDELMTLSLEELMNIQVVSASKKAENLFDAPLSASVLTGEEIRKAGATSLVEALRLVPGLIVREQTNGNYDVHLRGLDNVPPNSYSVYSANTTTLVMIDNRPVYNYLQGGTFWETLPIDLNDVEKIEVVRGPASALYGPNAVSGVIHILTRQAEKAGLQAVANAQYGTRQTMLANASVGYGHNAGLSGTVSGNFQRRGRETSYYVTPLDGRVSSAADIPLGNLAARYPHPERSMDKYGLNAFLHYAPATKAVFDLAAGTQASEVQNAYGENGATPLNTMTSRTRYADLKGRVYGVSTQLSYLGGQQDPSVGFKGSTFDFNTLDVSAEYEVRLQRLSLKPGLSYRRAVYDDTRYWDVTRDEGIFSGRYEVVTHAASLRSEYSLWDEKLRLVGGLRLDKFNYPDKWFASYQLAATAKPVAGHLLRAVYSRAYRSPFIYDNFIDLTLSLNRERPNFLYQVTGNKHLDLVRSDMVEVGYRGKIAGNLHLDAEVYYTQTRNYTDLVTGQTEIRETNPVTVITHLDVTNLPLAVNQLGATVSLNYVQGKVQVKPFVTVQETQLRNYSRFSNTAGAMPHASNGGNPALNNLYSGMGTGQKHAATPAVYGGAYVHCQVTPKLGFNVNPYYYSAQTFYHRDNLTYNDGVRGVGHINPKLILNARLSYSPLPALSVFANGRNVLNDRSIEHYRDDHIGSLYLLGVNWQY